MRLHPTPRPAAFAPLCAVMGAILVALLWVGTGPPAGRAPDAPVAHAVFQFSPSPHDPSLERLFFHWPTTLGALRMQVPIIKKRRSRGPDDGPRSQAS